MNLEQRLESIDRNLEQLSTDVRTTINPYPSTYATKILKRAIATSALLLAFAGGCGVGAAFGESKYSQCPDKWNKTYASLTEEQRAFVLDSRVSTLKKDIDGDGLEDTVTTNSVRWVRGCNPKDEWDEKENVLRIEYGNGKTRLFDWKGGLLISYDLEPAKREIITKELHADGTVTTKRIDYDERKKM